MNSVTNKMKGAAAMCAVSLALCLNATSANAEPKLASKNWNSSSFGAACGKSPRCTGSPSAGGRGYDAVIENEGTTTTVNCSSSHCTYDTRPTGGGGGQGGGGGSPARLVPKDKALGTGAGLGGLLMGGARTPPKLDVGQRIPVNDRAMGATKVDVKTPKIDKIETPKVSAPAGNPGKDIKANVLR